jgi:proteasome assembly chaperone (PAC2) family protein
VKRNNSNKSISYLTENTVHYESTRFTLCREIIAVCSEIHTEHVNTLCGQNVEFVNAKRILGVMSKVCCFRRFR